MGKHLALKRFRVRCPCHDRLLGGLQVPGLTALIDELWKNLLVQSALWYRVVYVGQLDAGDELQQWFANPLREKLASPAKLQIGRRIS
jgi:hypothetical protein